MVFVSKNLLWEIFSWLPVKTLTRFRGARRSCEKIVSHPMFFALHTERSEELTRLRIIPKPSFNYFEEVFDFSCTVDSFLHEQDAVMVAPMSPSYDFHVVGCCNGLTCVASITRYHRFNRYHRFDRVRVLNLATRVSSRLSPSVPLYFGSAFKFGFGCDDDGTYKVVAICGGKTELGVMVHNLGSSQWRECPGFAGEFNLEGGMNSHGVFHHGNIYWMVTRVGEALESAIVSFDLSAEILHLNPMPNISTSTTIYPREHNTRLSRMHDVLRVFKDTLCVWHRHTTHYGHILIWQMEKLANDDGTMRMHWHQMLDVNFLENIPRPCECIIPLYMTQDEDLLLLSSVADPPQWTAILYNPSQGQELFTVQTQIDETTYLDSIVFRESLINPPC